MRRIQQVGDRGRRGRIEETVALNSGGALSMLSAVGSRPQLSY